MPNPVSYAKHHKFIMGALAIIVVLGTAVGVRLLGKKNLGPEPARQTKVALVSAADYLKDRGTITANGIVESLEQADLSSQGAGAVTKIYVRLGQKVRRGQTLFTLQNNDILASRAQALAALKGQQARLDEMKKGVRTEQLAVAENQVNTARQALADTKAAQDSLVNGALSAYLNNGLSAIPGQYNTSKAKLTLAGSYILSTEGSYTISLPQGGEKPPFVVRGIEDDSGWITRGLAEPIGAGGLFFTVSTDGDVYPGDTWTVTVPNPQAPGYAAAKNGYESAQRGRDAAVDAATNALSAAQKSYDLTAAGATNEQIRVQEAAVEQAAASVQAVNVQLEKTFIRSPIDGEVAGLPIKYGELVSPGMPVASIVNKGGLQIKAYLSDFDLAFVQEKATVSINDSLTGKVNHLSPSVDPQTKNVEVQVLVDNPGKSGLVVGQNAALKIAGKQSSSSTVFLLPLQAVKITNSGASIFTVKDDQTLEEHPVKLGAVVGEFVKVTDGVKPEMKIVSTAYELKAGQKVTL